MLTDMRFFATLAAMTQNDFSLISGLMTLACWPTDAVRFLKGDRAISEADAPSLLGSNPDMRLTLVSGYADCFRLRKANGTVFNTGSFNINNIPSWPLELYVEALPNKPPSDLEIALEGPAGPDGARTLDRIIGISGISVTQDNDLWWFNGENPGGGYHIASTLTAIPVTTGTFKWDVVMGSNKVDLNNGGADVDSITAIDDNTVVLKSTAASAGAATITKDVRILLTYNGVAVCSYELAVFAPDHLVHLRNENSSHATWSYLTKIHYRIEDQFNQTLPHNIVLNEEFTADPTPDCVGRMDWRRGFESGAMVNPADWPDHVSGETSTHTPTPVDPADPDAGIKVYHWPGTWNIGSTTIGNGVTVGSAHWGGSPICVWQKYRGHADHE